MRPWATKYRDDLLTAISGEARQPVDLKQELGALAAAFGSAITLHVDLEGLNDTPTGTPALLIVEAARELLNNASYHAYGYPGDADRPKAQNELVQVTVRNDGPGIDADTLASTWARKQNTVHQLQAAGGCYQIASSPDSLAGTTITPAWPAVRGAGAKGPGTLRGDTSPSA